ncbi:DUF4097 family beta strand repeat-containing protein [Kitasatospora sp. LaBMicrA B282]|uniref:DUF4097 family beta strand repeat-containing protein n=1 Tax=Kitasatospora sp. LaBMicrA B282 TaxID=3420949 RepID=UPI003D0E836B
MPTFATPEPITAILEFDIASVRITASERTDTQVTVLPANPAQEDDVRVAEGTKVSCVDGRLQLKAPRKRSPFGRSGSLEITVELPTGSGLQINAPVAHVTSSGLLGACRVRTSLGDLRLDRTGPAELKTAGTVRLNQAAGDAEVTGMGLIELGSIDGTATVKNTNGEIVVHRATGEISVRSANGRIVVGTAESGVDAKTAFGDITVAEVTSGKVQLQTSTGHLEVGVREGTAAWLDLDTAFGGVHNALPATGAPAAGEETVEVRARTGLGDITIRRA